MPRNSYQTTVSRPIDDLEEGNQPYSSTCSFAPQNPTAPPANSNDKSFGNFWKDPSKGEEKVPNLYPPPPDDGTQYNFPTKVSLAQFISQTLNYVTAQLFITTAITVLAYSYKTSVNNYLAQHPAVLWLPIILSFVTLVGLYCSGDAHLKRVMFWLFTLSCGAMVATSTIQYSPRVILNALATLALTVTFVNIYAYRTARDGKDLTFMGPALFGCLFVILVLSLIALLIPISFLQVCIAFLAVIVFSALLLYDLNRLYSGAEREDEILAEPMLAAINIYLDIINIFLYLLQLCNWREE